MASAAIEAFHKRLADSLDEVTAELLRDPVGGGPEARELHRGLMLADRAARDWLSSGLAAIQPKHPNPLEDLAQLGTPESGYHELLPAAQLVRRTAGSTEESQIGLLAETLGVSLQELDTEASLAGNRQALNAIGSASAEALLSAADHLGGDDFVLSQANETMQDLIALRGWSNVLGEQFAL